MYFTCQYSGSNISCSIAVLEFARKGMLYLVSSLEKKKRKIFTLVLSFFSFFKL